MSLRGRARALRAEQRAQSAPGRCIGEALTRTQDAIGREVNPSVYPPDEFRAKLAARNHFLGSVLKGEKIFLIGDERELGRLAE